MSNTIDLIKAGRLLVLKGIYKRHHATLARIEANAKLKSDLIKVYRVTVNGDDWGLYTPEAYAELRLGFSSGDYAMHTRAVEYTDSFENVTTLDELNDTAGEL